MIYKRYRPSFMQFGLFQCIKIEKPLLLLGKTNPTKGTKIDGRKEAAMIYICICFTLY